MSPRKNEMPCQDPEVRAGNFDEVALGYTEEQATDEAKRCLKCKNRRSTGHNPKRSAGDNINVLGSYSFSRTDVFLEL